MIVTTQDLNQNYEIKGIIRFYYSTMFAKSMLGKEMPLNESIDFIIENILTKQSEELGGDAIIGLVMNIFPSPGAMAVNTNILFYGTSVKLK
ncbi:MAG: hypothetical protein IT279_01740 [Ignavibacteriaceae bacterium]|nr:hypothetical protein [Ignavibacteriaceae bacterium]